jgi:rSAM/selenodomain-associated transferase 1
MDTSSCILFFVKYPTPGRTKTRLAKTIGNKNAIKLYRQFVTDILNMLKEINCKTTICFEAKNKLDKFKQWLGEDLEYTPQQGNNIGSRMRNALQWAYDAGYSKAILIGSDSPDLQQHQIRKALTALDNNDAVIGPSSDGGYYLIGFKKSSFAPEIFEDISWSTGKELDETMDLFSKMENYTASILEKWHDIDTASDLKSLLARNKQTEFNKTKSYEYASQII